MDRQIVYDRENDRLVYLSEPATAAYWEDLWAGMLSKENIAKGDRFVLEETRRVLGKGSRVIDAGCGRGATVYGLAQGGFEASGIDYADGTVAAIREYFPDLNVQVGDVRDMPFEDASFDGVWSLGVIEHFVDGFAPVVQEMHRILRPGGFLFLTVPSVSPLKSCKIALGSYQQFSPVDQSKFFQFAFRPEWVVSSISEFGFRFQRSRGRAGSLGLKEDLGLIAKFGLPQQTNRAMWARAWWRAVDKCVCPLAFHSKFYLFQKQ